MTTENNTQALELTVQTNKAYNKKVEAQQCYALTVTFKRLHCKTPRAQYWETICDLTKTLNRSTLFCIVPEWRTTDGSIHYHGTVKIYDRIKWLKQTLPAIKRLGFVCIKPIKKDGMKGWHKYFTKEIEIAESIVGHPMPVEEIITRVKVSDTKSYYSIDDYIVEECLSEED